MLLGVYTSSLTSPNHFVTGATTCIQCRAGTFNNATGACVRCTIQLKAACDPVSQSRRRKCRSGETVGHDMPQCTLALMVVYCVGASTCAACRAGTFNDSAGVCPKQGLCFLDSILLSVTFNETALHVGCTPSLMDSKAYTKCVSWLQALRFAHCARQDSLGYPVESDPVFQTSSMMIAVI